MQQIKRRRAAGALIVLAIIGIAIAVVFSDDCWPEPEPVPAECKPGDLCPVVGDDVKPVEVTDKGAAKPEPAHGVKPAKAEVDEPAPAGEPSDAPEDGKGT